MATFSCTSESRYNVRMAGAKRTPSIASRGKPQGAANLTAFDIAGCIGRHCRQLLEHPTFAPTRQKIVAMHAQAPLE
jgi:hypothetical protein